MKNEKKLGIWMDHSNAHLIEFTREPIVIQHIDSTFTHHDKEGTLERSEFTMHNKEQHQQAAYYKQLGELIKEYTSVILFGPTDAKIELFHILEADHRFEDIIIDVKTTEKMTENQEYAFVKDYFSNKM